jgi:hypothetical protein
MGMKKTASDDPGTQQLSYNRKFDGGRAATEPQRRVRLFISLIPLSESTLKARR